MPPKGRRKSKSGKTGGAKKGKSSPNVRRASSAYSLWCSEHRGEVLERCGGGDPFALGDRSRLLAEAWHELPQQAREPYERRAVLDRHRSSLQTLWEIARRDDRFEKVAQEVKAALNSLARVQQGQQEREISGELVDAMEELERRMSPGVRQKVGSTLGSAAESPAVATTLRRALGDWLGVRVVAVLRNLRNPSRNTAAPSQSSASLVSRAPKQRKTSKRARAYESSNIPKDVRESIKQIVSSQPPPPEGDQDRMRSKVVGLVMRAFSKYCGMAWFGLSKEIEKELFDFVGDNPVEYKRRARSIIFNFGSPDGELLKRVTDKFIDTHLTPHELVRLENEELASSTVRAERQEQRDKYFRTQVEDRVGPPKRRRDLYLRGEMSKTQERMADSRLEENTQEEPQSQLAADELPEQQAVSGASVTHHAPPGSASAGSNAFVRLPMRSAGNGQHVDLDDISSLHFSSDSSSSDSDSDSDSESDSSSSSDEDEEEPPITDYRSLEEALFGEVDDDVGSRPLLPTLPTASDAAIAEALQETMHSDDSDSSSSTSD